MPARRFSVRIVSNRIPALIAQIQTKSVAATDNTASDIQQRAEATAPKDTGSLAVSIYRTNGEQSDYGQRVTSAEALNEDVVILDEVRPELVISLSGGTPPTYMSIVGAAASHAIFQELGTRFQRPQPFLLPSAMGNESDFVNAMSTVAN